MPATLTYPGVYIEEIPSGVRPISGVATSIAAFVGWAPRGPTDQAYKVNSWADYERLYGGLDPNSYLSYAVYHFFINGGNEAYVVRLVGKDPTNADDKTKNARAAVATVGGGLELAATGEGEWAHSYKVKIKTRSGDASRFGMQIFYSVRDPDALPATTGGATPPATPPATGGTTPPATPPAGGAPAGTPPTTALTPAPATIDTLVESFDNLSLDPADPRFVKSVVNEESRIVNVTKVPTTITDDDGKSLSNGQNGPVLAPTDTAFPGLVTGTGQTQLDDIDLFNLLCVPGMTDATALGTLMGFCRDRRAFLIADCANDATPDGLKTGPGLNGRGKENAAFYFPWIKAPDPLQQNRLREFPPSGFVAGIYAQTDTNRGVWKAPAGTETSLSGATGVKTFLNDIENGDLNIHAVNCIRTFPIYGTVVWGARTVRGSNEEGSEWKYVPVRRMALFLEESLYRGLKWVVFEPNDEPLWGSIRLNVNAFMQQLFRQGAFQGSTPREAYFVKCDHETTTQTDINLGIVNIIVGFAPLKPAEFVVIKLQQMAGQSQA